MRGLYIIALLACATATHAEDWLYLTYPGDTPLKIGHAYLKKPGDWRRVLQLNKIVNEFVLPTGTRIRIPVDMIKVTPAPAEVSHVTGNVRVKDAEGFRPLAKGEKIAGGQTVVTGPRSFASFRLADGSALSVQASSKLTFGRLAAFGATGMVATELALDSGRIEVGASKQIGPAGGFQVRTPVAVAGLRGTAFRLAVSEDGRLLHHEVTEGTVALAAQDKEVLVTRALGTLVEQGQAPQSPRALLPAPDLSNLPTRLTALPLAFTWPAQAGADTWRAQLATDAQFQNILFDQETTNPQVSWNELPPDGTYYLRVRAIDPIGLQGLDAVHGFILDAQPLPPQAEAPEDGARHYHESIAFSWAASPEARGYVLQVAPTPDFSPNQTVERRLDPVLNHSEKFTRGLYYWRLASLDDADQPHSWGETRQLRVQPLPTPPRGEAKSDNGQAVFAWTPSPGAESYELEIATRTDFSNTDIRLKDSRTRVTATLKPGKYYWRIRGVEADGQAGSWSRPGTLVMAPEAPRDIRVKISDGALLLNWQGSAPAYRLEFARDANFNTTLFNHREENNSTRLLTPEPGQYWVRVIALSETGSRGGQSKAVPFTIGRWE